MTTVQRTLILNFDTTASGIAHLTAVAEALNTMLARHNANPTAPTDTAQAVPAEVAGRMLTPDTLLALLRDKSTYQSRTLVGINEHFPDYAQGQIEDALQALYGRGDIEVLIRRRDGEPLFTSITAPPGEQATSGAGTNPPPAEVAVATTPSVRDFLAAPSDFEFRTMEALYQHFQDVEDVNDAVYTLEDNSELVQKTRRRDGMSLVKLSDYGRQVHGRDSGGQATIAEADAPAGPVATDAAVLAFLTADPRFTLRSMDSIEAHFSGSTDWAVHEVLDGLADADMVKIKHRRSDGALMYAASASTLVAGNTAEVDGTIADDVDKVVDFIHNGSDVYVSRTRTAIAKHFPQWSENQLTIILDTAEDNGWLIRERRVDGVTVFTAKN